MKKQLFHSALLAFAFLLTSCSGDDSSPVNESTNPNPNNPNPTYEIGDTGPGGGIVFHVDANGNRYEAGQELGLMKWEDVENLYDAKDISALSTAIGAGEANTALIVSTIGSGNYAAKACADYAHGGKDDWFLPSKDELVALYNYSRSHWNLNIEIK